MIFKKTDAKLFFKSQKSNDLRLGEKVIALDYNFFEMQKDQKDYFLIAGYPDDEGIKNNSGRLGAALAPYKIREFFYKMTPAAQMKFDLGDLGDLEIQKFELEMRHEKAKEIATQALKNNYKWIALGGGHDYAFADVSAFIETCEDRPLIINFDAHLDVRSTENGINSGTPFFRILEKYQEIDLVQIGIQAQCNSLAHFDYSREHQVEVLKYDDFRLSGENLSSYCIKRLSHLITKRRKCFLSIDIDGFSSAYAPGCSQSFATGFQIDEFFQLTSILNKRLDVRGIGIYECSPPLDQDNQTSKLAALIMHKFVFAI